MSSMVTQADIAVATLQTEIKLSDTISPICLPKENKLKKNDVLGIYSGLSGVVKNFNSTFTTNDDDAFEEVQAERNGDFAEGIEYYCLNRRSEGWDNLNHVLWV